MPVPRSLVGWSIAWAIASFLATVGLQSPIQPTTGTYAPAVRTMLALLALGGCALWPAARLACARGPWPPARVALDATTIVVAMQAIYWPLHLVTSWTLAQACATDLMLSGWIAATGAWVALALQAPAARPARAIAWLCAMPLGAALDALGVRAPLPELAGPLAALFRLTPAAADAAADPAWAVAAWPWILAFVGWALAVRRGTPVAHDPGVG